MPTRVVLLRVIASGMLALPALVGCAADTENGDNDVVDTDNELTSTVSVPSNGTKSISVAATATKDVTLTIDCHPSADPDVVGTALKIASPTLRLDGAAETVAGFYQKTASIPKGTHTITLTSQGGSATCSVKSTPVPASATCRASTAWHSVNPDHTHYPVGSEGNQAGWEPFPASGNHWGAWAPWNKVYDKPVKRGFLLHNLEHGGVVFSYKCSSASDSAACKSARDELVSLVHSLGLSRVLVTPDPTQPTMFAVRAWRYAFTSDCLDEASAGAFAKAHIRHGREDIEDDPPIPFDPTTTNVPCNDLMAAPDSCN